jgi:hypothetical protein
MIDAVCSSETYLHTSRRYNFGSNKLLTNISKGLSYKHEYMNSFPSFHYFTRSPIRIEHAILASATHPTPLQPSWLQPAYVIYRAVENDTVRQTPSTRCKRVQRIVILLVSIREVLDPNTGQVVLRDAPHFPSRLTPVKHNRPASFQIFSPSLLLIIPSNSSLHNISSWNSIDKYTF